MKEKIIEIIRKSPRMFGGLACGLLCALLLLILGFWRTLLLAALCALGAYVGYEADHGVKLTELVYRIVVKIRKLFGIK